MEEQKRKERKNNNYKEQRKQKRRTAGRGEENDWKKGKTTQKRVATQDGKNF